MYTSLVYNINVATSVTSQGRALISSQTMFFEMFLANNVKFGSINEVLQFIDNIITERHLRKFNDFDILDKDVSLEDCFTKVILTCGWNWIPTFDEMDIIWRVLSNLDRQDINRIYYKNNLYEFMSNSYMINLIKGALHKLESPMLNSVAVPEEIQSEMKLLSDLLMEYVYYRYQIIDRTGRCSDMIKSVVMISDTDSTIISLDAWYRFVVQLVDGEELKIANEYKVDEPQKSKPKEKRFDYDFINDQIIDAPYLEESDNTLTPNQNVRLSIINMLGYVLDRLVNDYMIQFCKNNHSVKDSNDTMFDHELNRKCKIISKNEFLFSRVLMGTVKKSYASIMELQEGNLVPEDKQLDVKGMEVFVKSTKTASTKEALKKILLEDILKAPKIDQLRVIKDIIIFEKRILESVRNGSKEYFKPATIKSQSNYDDPMRIQGIKGAVAWNELRSGTELEAIDLTERNAVDIAKVKIDRLSAESIKDTYPQIYNNIIKFFDLDDAIGVEIKEEVDPKTGKIKKSKKDNRIYKGSIDAISIPKDTPIPDWLKEFIDYNSIVEDNVKGFPYESIGIQRLDKSHVSYTNIIKL